MYICIFEQLTTSHLVEKYSVLELNSFTILTPGGEPKQQLHLISDLPVSKDTASVYFALYTTCIFELY